MNAKTVAAAVREKGIIAIVRGVPADRLCEVGRALLEGGVSLMEVTFDPRTDGRETVRGIASLCDAFGDRLLVGAGTVLSPRQVDEAASAGARYIISPDTKPAVIERTRALGLCSIPGALTPSEITLAYDSGADFVKLFPVASLGTEYIRALCAPLCHIPLLAVGGVTPDNLAGFLQAGVCGVGVGGSLVSARRVQDGDFAKITETARQFARAMDAAR